MSASFTFGSFGDIITTAQLVWRLAQALSDSRGSAPEFRELVNELNLFYGALYELTRFWQSRAQTAELQRLALEIQQVADDCRCMIESFLAKGHKRYGKSFLKPKDAPKSFSDSIKRIRWASLEKGDVAKMKGRLKSSKDIIDMIQSVAQRLADLEVAKTVASSRMDNNFADVIESLKKQEDVISRVDDNVISLLSDRQSACTRLSNIERQVTLLPRVHAALSMYTDNHAYIEDSLGSPFPVPLQINPSWEDPNTRSELQLTREFYSSVRPGQRLFMAMVFYGTAQRYLGDCLSDTLCPKCGLPQMRQGASGIDRSCNNPDCGFTYREIVDVSDTSVNNLNNWLAGRDTKPQHEFSPGVNLPNGDDINRIVSLHQATDGPEIFKRVKFLSRWEDSMESRGTHEMFNNGTHFWYLNTAGSGHGITHQIFLMTYDQLDLIPENEWWKQADCDLVFPEDNIVFQVGFAGSSARFSVPVIILFCADLHRRKLIADWMYKLDVVKSSRLRVLVFHPLARYSKEQWHLDWERLRTYE
ncbi:Metallo-dependent hydrolase [Apiospora arundinis]